MDYKAKRLIKIFMEEWSKAEYMADFKKWPPMSFRIFEQPKEDSSEDISDKTLAYLHVSYIIFVNASAFAYNIWVIFLYCYS